MRASGQKASFSSSAVGAMSSNPPGRGMLAAMSAPSPVEHPPYELDPLERQLAELLDDAVVPLHGVADGSKLWANKAELAMLGYARDEYVGRPSPGGHDDGPAPEGSR